VNSNSRQILQKTRTYLEASLKSEQNNLREMVQQAQQGKS